MGRTLRGAGRIGPRRVGGLWMGTKPEEDSMGDGALEVSLEELREFVEGGRLEARARPEFKERLRERLWTLVRERARRWRGTRS